MPRISLIIPTRNESQTIRQCIHRALEAFEKAGLEGEIIVADSSTDQTADIAASCGAKV
ncbi:MAG: glycosyltransferase, partial [Methanosarcinales archaeon]|nr:glycosyltransferase [Methanosarcinales archaeon]